MNPRWLHFNFAGHNKISEGLALGTTTWGTKYPDSGGASTSILRQTLTNKDRLGKLQLQIHNLFILRVTTQQSKDRLVKLLGSSKNTLLV